MLAVWSIKNGSLFAQIKLKFFIRIIKQ